MVDEMSASESNRTWELIPLPSQKFVVGYKQCCQISTMADCGSVFLENRHGQFVKDDDGLWWFYGSYGGLKWRIFDSPS